MFENLKMQRLGWMRKRVGCFCASFIRRWGGVKEAEHLSRRPWQPLKLLRRDEDDKEEDDGEIFFQEPPERRHSSCNWSIRYDMWRFNRIINTSVTSIEAGRVVKRCKSVYIFQIQEDSWKLLSHISGDKVFKKVFFFIYFFLSIYLILIFSLTCNTDL